MTTNLRVALPVILMLLIVSGCAASNNQAELVIYSARNERFIEPIIDAFEEATGHRVRLLSGNEALVNRILEEQNNVQADLFFSNDAGALEFLKREGALDANDSAALEIVDARFRAEDGSWVGLSARTRVLMYNKDLITAEEMPQDLWELTDPKWAGQFVITRGGNGSMVAHIAALRAVWGDERTEEWIRAVREHAGAIVSGHGDIRRAVGAGEYAFGLVNNYYYHQQLQETTDNNVGAIYPDQGPDGMGAFVNAAGVGLIRGAPNRSLAVQFIDFLLEPEQQEIFASHSREVPLNPAIPSVPEALTLADYRTMDMPLREVGAVWADAKELIERAGLDLDLR